MANTTINLNPAKFAKGLANTMGTALKQTLVTYVPYTSDVLMDISDTVFDAREYISENRPDKMNRNDSNIIKSFTNKAAAASKNLLVDISHGDISFESSKQALTKYMSKYTQDEFNFDFGEDSFDFDSEEDDNMFSGESTFTADDFAEGMYESTSATIGAIEASTKNIAMTTARSNDILGDRLIANNMANMAQVMQMTEVINKNISGINTNLASLVEYNNTTMNDFVKNTIDHYAKIEGMLQAITDKVTKKEKEEKKSDEDNDNIYDKNGKLRFGKLFKKGVGLADMEFFEGMGILPSVLKAGGSMLFKDNMPKFLKELEGQDLSMYINMFNPAEELIKFLFPDMKQLKRTDNIVKNFVNTFKRKIKRDKANGGFWDSNSKIGEFFMRLFGEDTDYKFLKEYENKEASWTTSDSHVLQQIIPSSLSETNVNLYDIKNNVANIVDLLRESTKTTMSMYEELIGIRSDSEYHLYQYTGNQANYGAFMQHYARWNQQKTHKNDYFKRYGRTRINRGKTLKTYTKKYKNKVFDSATAQMKSADEIIEKYEKEKFRVATTGAEGFNQILNRIISENGRFTEEAQLSEHYGYEEYDAFKKAKDALSESVFIDNQYTDYQGNIDETSLIAQIEEILSKSLNRNLSDYDRIQLANYIIDMEKSRKEKTESFKEKAAQSLDLRTAQQLLSSDGKADLLWASSSMRESYDSKKYNFKHDLQRLTGFNSEIGFFKAIAEANITDLTRSLTSEQLNTPEMQARLADMQKDADRRLEGMTKQWKKGEAVRNVKMSVAQNPVNVFIGAMLDVANKYGAGASVRLMDGQNPFSVPDIEAFFDEFGLSLENRNSTVQKKVNDRGDFVGYYVYDKEHFGQRRYIDMDGNDHGWEEDPAYRTWKDKYESLGYYENDKHKMVKEEEPDDNDRPRTDLLGRPVGPKLKYADEQYDIPNGSYETGAFRIDKDKIVQVHEGEMILDRALSSKVRENIANMINAGGYGMISEKERQELFDSITMSNDEFKGHEQEVIDAINNELSKRSSDANKSFRIKPSDESLCFMKVDRNDSLLSILTKKVVEIATNMGIVTRTSLGDREDAIEEKEKENLEGTGKFSKDNLVGEKSKETGYYSGGLLSKKVNKFKDDFRKWRFDITGKSYTGYERDADGNIIEDSIVEFEDSEEHETVLKQIKNTILEKAEQTADRIGMSSEQKAEYVRNVSGLMDGVPNGVKGALLGMVARATLGISLGPVLGLVGGFALSNDATKELIFGKEYTDSSGVKVRYGGLFSGMINNLTAAGKDAKEAFIAGMKDAANNLKVGLSKFSDMVAEADPDKNILAKGMRKIFTTNQALLNMASDIAGNGLLIGTKLLTKGLSIPVNMLASVIGGESYREMKRAEKRVRNQEIWKEFLANQYELGGIWNKDFINMDVKDALSMANQKFSQSGFAKFVDSTKFGHVVSAAHGGINNMIDNVQSLKSENPLADAMNNISQGISKLTNTFDAGQLKAAYQGITGILVALGMGMTGNIPAAIATAAMVAGNAVVKELAGASIIGVLGSGFKMLGNRFKRVTRRDREIRRNIGHAVLEKFGIKDNGFYIKQIKESTAAEKAKILSDLGYSNEDQERYYDIRRRQQAGEDISLEDSLFARQITENAKRGHGKDYVERRSKLNADNREYKEMNRQFKNDFLSDDEYAELKALRKLDSSGKANTREKSRYIELMAKSASNREAFDMDRYQELRKGASKRRAENFRLSVLEPGEFFSNYGSKRAIGKTLDYNMDNEVGFLRNEFNNSLTTDLLDPKFEGLLKNVTPERRQEIAAKFKKERTDLAKEVMKKYGADINDTNREEVQALIMEKLGKTKGAFDGKSNEDVRRFLFGENVIDKQLDAIGNFQASFEHRMDELKELFKTIRDDVIGKADAIIDKLADNKTEEKSTFDTLERSESMDNYLKNYQGAQDQNISELDFGGLQFHTEKPNMEGIDNGLSFTDNVMGVGIGTKYGNFLSGATNVPTDMVAHLHGGEMVLDPNTAAMLRSNMVGAGTSDVITNLQDINNSIKELTGSFIGGDPKTKGGNKLSIGSVFESMKSGIGTLVGVFKGDKNGTDEEQMGIMDKMKASFANMGEKISGTVMSSGLIPLTIDGKPDLAKIGARLIALIGGAILLGPVIGKVVEKLTPILQPIFDKLKEGISGALKGAWNLLLDGVGLSEGASFAEFWTAVWKKAGAEWYDLLNGKLDALVKGTETAVAALNDIAGDTEETENYYDSEEGKKNYNDLRQSIVNSAAYKNTGYSAESAFASKFGLSSNAAQYSYEELEQKFNTLKSNAESGNTEAQKEFRSLFNISYDDPNATSLSHVIGHKRANQKANFLENCEAYFQTINRFIKDGLQTSLFKEWSENTIFEALNQSEVSYINLPTTDFNKRAKYFIKVVHDVTGFNSGLKFDSTINRFTSDNDKAFEDLNKVSKASDKITERIKTLNYLYENYGNSDVLYAKYKPQTHDPAINYFKEDENGYLNYEDKFYTTDELENPDNIYYGYTQNDPRWANLGYGRFKSGSGSTMGMGGCGPTAMANVYSNLTGRRMNPAQMARFSQANGYNAQGGTSAGLFTSGARRLGLSSNAIGKSGSAIGRSVRRGNNVVVAGRNGPYTKSGHIMSVRGVDSRGNAIVDDPLRRGARRIPMSSLTKGMTHAWSIGYGEGNVNGQKYSTWNDMFTDGEITFNPNGGAFGYTSAMDAGCLYNSIVNGYINAMLGKNGDFLAVADRLTPYALLVNSTEDIGVNKSSNAVTGPLVLMTKLNGIMGTNIAMTDIGNRTDYGNPTETLLANLRNGVPVVIHSNDATGGLLSILSANASHSLPQHAVLLPGIFKKDGKEYIVIDNPGRSGSAQVNKAFTVEDFTAAMNDAYNNSQLNHAYIFSGSGLSITEENFNNLKKAALDKNNMFADKYRSEFKQTFGVDPEAYNSFDEYKQDHMQTVTSTDKLNAMLSGSATTTGGADGTTTGASGDLRDHVDFDNFGDYAAELISRLGQFASNLMGTFLTGNTSGLFSSGSSSSSGAGGVNGGGASGSGGGVDGGMTTASRVVINQAFVMSMIEAAHTSYAIPEISKELSENGLLNYVVNDTNYTKLTKNAAYSTITDLIALSSAYKKYVMDSVPQIYTWILALQVLEFVGSTKNYSQSDAQLFSQLKAMISRGITTPEIKDPRAKFIRKFSAEPDDYATYTDYLSGIKSNDKYLNSKGDLTKKVDSTATNLYNKIKTLNLTIMGTPTNDYYKIPSWAKGNTPVFNMAPSTVPGGVGGGTGLSPQQLAAVHSYLLDIVTANETGGTIHTTDEAMINKTYFNPVWLSGEGNVTMGRIGFYASNARNIFGRAAQYPNISPSTKEALNSIYNGINNKSMSPSQIVSIMNQHPEMKPLIMSAEDAMANEFVWDYTNAAYNQFVNRGMSDPRSIILGAEFGGVAPGRIKDFYSAVTNPGASNELDQVRQGMFNTIATFGNYGLYKNGWQNRINGMYNALTTSSGYNTQTGKNYPLPSEIAAMVPAGSVGMGYGDAGYNMRDNDYRYSNDIYMGDADHPMNVKMDNTPVTSRLDRLVELVDYAVNGDRERETVSTNSNAKSLGFGDKKQSKPTQTAAPSVKGATSTGQRDKLSTLHSKLARRTRVAQNYNQY